jgi:glutaconate CoA-transferase, subunit A
MAKLKLMRIEDAVKRFIHSRTFIASSGFPLMRKPQVFWREIIRQHINDKMDLAIMSPGMGDETNGYMVAAGLVESCITVFISQERPGTNPNLRRSIEKSIPRRIRIEDYSNFALNLAMEAAALNMPFIPCLSGRWGDFRKPGYGRRYNEDGTIPVFHYPKDIIMKDPFGSEVDVALIQAVFPDVSVLMAQAADPYGNAVVVGQLAYDQWTPFAARKHIIVVADRIVDTAACKRFPNLTLVPGFAVSAVIPWYGGSWPSNSVGHYAEDIAHMNETLKRSKTQEGAMKCIEDYCLSYKNHDEYIQMIGKDNLEKLEKTETKYLMDPFREFFLSDAEVEKLMKQSEAERAKEEAASKAAE